MRVGLFCCDYRVDVVSSCGYFDWLHCVWLLWGLVVFVVLAVLLTYCGELLLLF